LKKGITIISELWNIGLAKNDILRCQKRSDKRNDVKRNHSSKKIASKYKNFPPHRFSKNTPSIHAEVIPSHVLIKINEEFSTLL